MSDKDENKTTEKTKGADAGVKPTVKAVDAPPEPGPGETAKTEVSEDTISDAEKVVRLTRENLSLREQAQKGAIMDRVVKINKRIMNLLQEENCTPIEFDMALAMAKPQLLVNSLKMEQNFREQTAAKGSQPDGKFKAAD